MMRFHKLMLLLILVSLSMVALSCAPQATAVPSATSAPATQVPTATNVPATQAPTATTAATKTAIPPTQTPVPVEPTATTEPTESASGDFYPPETRTGISDVDSVITAVLSDDLAARRALVHFLTAPCTTAQGAGGPPKCAADQAEGTEVEVFPIMEGEGQFASRDTLDLFLDFTTSGLYAVYEVPADAYHEIYWPAGQYGLIFARDNLGGSVTVFVQDGAIVRLTLSHRSPSEELTLSKGQTILPPPQ